MSSAPVTQLLGLSMALAATAFTLALSAASADLLAGLNAVRTHGCGGRPGVTPPLRENSQLVAAARHEPADRDLLAALAATGYRATVSAMIHVTGESGARFLTNFLASKYCGYLSEPAYTEIGIHQRGRETWIVFAAPFSPPSLAASRDVTERVLDLVNRARAQARLCGNTRHPPAGALRLSVTLNRAAQAHAADMAQHGYLSHAGRDGSTLAERVTRSGYRWRSVGENIAAGQAAPEAVVADWIRSPEHCANLMAPRFTEMGVAYSVNRAGQAGIHWVQLFGAPR